MVAVQFVWRRAVLQHGAPLPTLVRAALLAASAMR